MTHPTDAERADFELMREAYEKAFGPPPAGAAWASAGYAIKTHEASEARAYAERFKGFIAGWVGGRAPVAQVPHEYKPLMVRFELRNAGENLWEPIFRIDGTPIEIKKLPLYMDSGVSAFNFHLKIDGNIVAALNGSPAT